MARGRMVSKSLSTSMKFARLHAVAGRRGGDFAQSLYPLLIVHADDWGREAGDAFTVKHQVHPTSPHTVAEFEMALEALAKVGLIDRYTSPAGAILLAIVNFDAHQSGLHKRTPSRFPAPKTPVSELPGNSRTSRNFPEILGQEKRREENKDKYQVRHRGESRSACGKPVENLTVIAQLIAVDLLPLNLPETELPEAVKRRCAELHIAYDATVIRKAIDSARHHRRSPD